MVIYESFFVSSAILQAHTAHKGKDLIVIFISFNHLVELFAHNKQPIVAEWIDYLLLSVDAMVKI